MAFYVAFYSYKGGVGRTLALANTAYSLAEHGKRVVLVDMDLEAPGLPEYKEFAVRAKNPKGLVEYAATYRQTGKCPSIKGYVHACKESPGTGQLWLMPAGAVGGSYQKQLADLSWRKLHPQKGTLPFLEAFKKALAEEYQPDYVLIDSRTGLSDIGGLSTHQIADLIVLVFNLTRSCLEGSARTYRSFVSDTSKARFLQLVASPVPPLPPSPDSLVERQLAYASEHMPLGVAFGRTILRIDYNPAMVLAEELAVRHPAVFPAAERYEALREAIQRVNPEEVFPVLEQARELRSAGQTEAGLAVLRSFVEAHPGNVEGYLELGDFFFDAGRSQDAIPAFRKVCELAPTLSRPYRRLGEALVAAGQVDDALVALKRAEELGDRGRETYQALARVHAERREVALETEARRKAILAVLAKPSFKETAKLPPPQLQELRHEFVSVLSRRPPFASFQAEHFWDSVMGSLSVPLAIKPGILRSVLVGTLKPVEISSLLQSLQEEAAAAEERLGPGARDLQQRLAAEPVDPTDTDALLTLRRGDRVDAALLSHLADLENPPTARAVAFLEEALQFEPENAYVLRQLGFAAGALASSVRREEKALFLEKSRAALERAVRFAGAEGGKLRRLDWSFNNWGSTLVNLADLAEGEDKRRLLLDACLKYEKALGHKPDNHEALSNWGGTLVSLADLTEGEDKRRLLLDACLKYEKALRHKPDNHEALNNWGATLVSLADFTEGEDKRRLLLDACLKCEEALRHKPDNHEASYNWGIALGRLAGLAEGEDKRRLLLDACLKYEEALLHKPDKHEASYNWGVAVGRLANLAEGEDKRRLLLDACLKYEEALRHKPDNHEALNNWGSTLVNLADLAEDEDKRSLLLDACHKYEEALRHKPDDHEALNNWGSTLVDLADLAEGEDKRRLLPDACLKYEEALLHKPDKHEALVNWGSVLVRLADLAVGEDKRRLLLDACLKCEEALRHKPDNHEALDLWASALLKLWYGTEGTRRRTALLQEAGEKACRASNIAPGTGDYNLACAKSLLGELDEAARLVTVVLERKPHNAGQVLQDPDFAPLWKARPDLRAKIEASLVLEGDRQRRLDDLRPG